MKILVIDDSRINRKILLTHLSVYGEVTEAKNGWEGLQLFLDALGKKEPFGLVTLDLLMPVMDGQHTLIGIRKGEDDFNIKEESRAKVVIITSESQKDELVRVNKLCQGCLFKPITKASLQTKITEVLSVSMDAGTSLDVNSSDSSLRIPAIRINDGELEFAIRTVSENNEIIFEQISPESYPPFKSVMKGQVLAELLSGKVLPGNGVKYLPEKKAFIAEQNGFVEYKENIISVNGVIEVDGDLKICEINFSGAIKVKGSVKDGVKLKAGQDIEIAGDAFACQLEAIGNITVGRVYGKDKAFIKCAKSFLAESVYNAQVEAVDMITVSKESISSILKSGSKIKADTIVGGQSLALNSLEINRVGSRKGFATVLTAGVDFHEADKLESLELKIKSAEKEIGKLNIMLGAYIDNYEAVSSLPEQKKKRVAKLLEKRLNLQNVELPKFKTDVENIKSGLFVHGSEVKITGKLYRGVSMCVCGVEKTFANDIDASLVFNEEN